MESTTIANRSLKETVLELKQQSFKNIFLGSRSLIIQLMKINLIDDLQSCVYPIDAGKGWSLFENITETTILKLMTTKHLVVAP